MRIRHWNLVLVISIGLLIVLGCGAPAATPAAPAATSQPAAVQPTEPSLSELPTPTIAAPTAQPALPERRRLTLEFPPRIRVGDSDLVRLTLEVDDKGNITPTAQIGGNVVTGEVIEVPNLYETHQVTAEARFDIAGMEVRPAELVGEPLTQGTSVTFYWSIRPPKVGVYRGTIWLYLQFVDKSSGEESQKTVSAQIVELEAVNLLGLSGAFARTTGIIGSVVGTVIGFPFLEDIVKFIFKSRGKLKK